MCDTTEREGKTMTKMDPEVKAKWLERLRSGEVEQTKDFLGRSDGSRCCLGVLCDIAVEEGVVSRGDSGSEEGVLTYVGPAWEDDYGQENDDEMETELPKAVLTWAGIEDPAVPVQHPEYGPVSVAVLNDGSHLPVKGAASRGRAELHTFEQIAALIDESL